MPIAPSRAADRLPRMAQEEQREQREEDPRNLQPQDSARPRHRLQHRRSKAPCAARQPPSAFGRSGARAFGRNRGHRRAARRTAASIRRLARHRPALPSSALRRPRLRRRCTRPRRSVANLPRCEARSDPQHSPHAIRLHGKSLSRTPRSPPRPASATFGPGI